MDYSKLSDDTLDKLSRNEPLDYSKLTDDELTELSKMPSSTPKMEPVKRTEQPGYTESALRGAAQGVTFGFADELQAKLESLLKGENYDKRVREIRDEYKAAAEANPITYYGADIASGFALPIGAIGGFATKGASTLGKIARSSGSGAIIGGVTGAGTSEAETTGELAKDIGIGTVAGAIAAPVLEGSITAAKGMLGKAGKDIGAIRDVKDFYKYGTEGKALTGPENLRKLTSDAKKTIQSDFIPELEQALKVKNQAYDLGKKEALEQGRTVDIKRFEDLVAKAEQAGADPKQIEKLRKELSILGKKTEVDVTDPGEYQRLYREKLTEESQKLKESAYQLQIKNAEKAGQKAYKDAERLNKDAIKSLKAELKIKYPTADDKFLLGLAEDQLGGKLKDPSLAAKEAREKVIREADEAFKGTAPIVNKATGEVLGEAQTGPNQRVLGKLIQTEEGVELPNLSATAALSIEKTADKNAAYAFALAERENQKAIQKLADVYRERQFMVSRDDIVSELKRANRWIDPAEAAKTAKEQTKLMQNPIDIERAFSPEIGRDVLTAKAGEQELLTKILPQFKFTKTEYQKPDLDVMDVEAFRNYLSDIINRDKQIDFRSLSKIQDISKEVKADYNKLLGEKTAEQALATDKQVRGSLAELGVDSLIGDSSIENKVNLTDKLSRLLYKANTAKGADETVKVEEAFRGLKDIYKDNPDKLRSVEAAFNTVKDKMRQAYLSDITTGHNTFAIDPTSINWIMTAGGKVGMAANEAGLLVNKIANSPVGKLLAESKKLAQKGYKKYSSAFEQMSSIEDVNKRRAIMYTLLQDPEFRKYLAEDIVGGEENVGD